MIHHQILYSLVMLYIWTRIGGHLLWVSIKVCRGKKWWKVFLLIGKKDIWVSRLKHAIVVFMETLYLGSKLVIVLYPFFTLITSFYVIFHQISYSRTSNFYMDIDIPPTHHRSLLLTSSKIGSVKHQYKRDAREFILLLWQQASTDGLPHYDLHSLLFVLEENCTGTSSL